MGLYRKYWLRRLKIIFSALMRRIVLLLRRLLVVNRLLDGFEGKVTTSRYATLAKCSQDTAHRDILALIEQRVLVQNPEGGRSTSYSLAPTPTV